MSTPVTTSRISHRVRAVLSGIARGSLRRLIASRAGLRAVNAYHRRLNSEAKRRFFYWFFDEGWQVEGRWRVDFAGHTVILPLIRDFPLSWAAALAFHGYDLEIHLLYESLLMTPTRPRVFFDVGANHGLHSLKLLAAGARVVSFEPNPDCHPWFVECCTVNGFRPEIEAVALGDRLGSVELAVPDGRSYHGTVVSSVRAGWNQEAVVKTLRVAQITVDDFVTIRGVTPDLVKIDTEGAELAVLRGGRRLLSTGRPLVIFESWGGSPDRAEIFDLLTGADYEIEPLGVPFGNRPALGLSAFLTAAETNFLARPRAESGTSRLLGAQPPS